MSSALIFRELNVVKKYEKYAEVIEMMIGRKKAYFNNEMYLSEVENAHANYSLLYMMEEYGTLPEGCDVKETLKFYTRCCAMNLRIRDYAVLAATLANGGICPITEERCFQDSNVVKLTL